MRIFISYRRLESSGYSRLLYENLRSAIPRSRVYMDLESTPLGDQWRLNLEEEMNAADVVLVLIGREWISMRDERGLVRLHNPEDVTRKEIETALEQDKRVIPVLLEGASIPKKIDLPQSLARLPDLQALSISNESFDAGIEKLVEELTGNIVRDQLQDAKEQWRMHRIKKWAMPSIALFAVTLSWISFLDFFALDTRSTTWMLAIADVLLPPELHESISLVAIPKTVNPLKDDTRLTYARLLDNLVASGSRTVVLDLSFVRSGSNDETLVKSFRNAKEKGVNVFFGFTELTSDGPKSLPILQEAASGVGLACLGHRLGYAQMMPIAFGVDQELAPSDTVKALPSLALLGHKGPVSVLPFDSHSRSYQIKKSDESTSDLSYSMTETVSRVQRGCQALRPSGLAVSLLLRLSTTEHLRSEQRRHMLDDVLSHRVPADRLKDRTVIVGYETKSENFVVARGFNLESRFGYELIADAINTLKTKRITRFIGLQGQLVMAGVLAVLGGWLGKALQHYGGFYRRSLIAIAVIVYVIFSVILVALSDILLYITYDLFAFFAGYFLIRRMTKKQPAQ